MICPTCATAADTGRGKHCSSNGCYCQHKPANGRTPTVIKKDKK